MNKSFVVISLLFALVMVSGANAWWNESWDKRVPIIIDYGENNTDYSVLINVTYDSDMLSNFDDLRFVDSDDSTTLPFYLADKTDGVNAYFWVKMDVQDTNKTIYAYYNNLTNISSTSDWNSAFLYSDDFSSGLGVIWNGTKSTADCNYSVHSGVLDMGCNNSGDWNYTNDDAVRVWIDDAISHGDEFEYYVEVIGNDYGTTSYSGLALTNDFSDVLGGSNVGEYLETGNLASVTKSYLGLFNSGSKTVLTHTSRFHCMIIRYYPDSSGDYYREQYMLSSLSDCRDPTVDYLSGVFQSSTHAVNDVGLYFRQETASENDYVQLDNFRVRKINGVFADDKYLSEEPDSYLQTEQVRPIIVNITSPENTTYNAQPTYFLYNVGYYRVDLTMFIDEGGDSLDSIWYSLNGTSNVTVVGNTTVDVTYGLNNLVVYVNNTLGDVASDSVEFFWNDLSLGGTGRQISGFITGVTTPLTDFLLNIVIVGSLISGFIVVLFGSLGIAISKTLGHKRK